MAVTTEFRLPQLADSVTSVKLSVWLKREGDRVQAGEPIVEVETDKTNVELEAPASGVVRTIHVAAGTEGLEAGVLLALIADEADGETATPASTTPEPVETDTGSAVSDAPSGRGDETAAPREPARPGRPPTPVADGAPAPVATPMARRMAVAAGRTSTGSWRRNVARRRPPPPRRLHRARWAARRAGRSVLMPRSRSIR